MLVSSLAILHCFYVLFAFVEALTVTAIAPTIASSIPAPPQDIPIQQITPTVASSLSLETSGLSSNLAIASLCSNNEISTVTQSWTSYAVLNYMTSLLSAAPPSATVNGGIDGIELMHSDVNPPGAACSYTSKCDSIDCSSIKDYNDGTVLSIQRFLAYTALINLNNYSNGLYSAMLDSGTIGSLVSPDIVTTFFTNPSPDASWEQVMGTITPLLGIGSALSGLFTAGGSALLGAASGIFSMITAFALANNIPPVVDQRFSEYATIADFVGDYLKATASGIETAYNDTIGDNSTIAQWTEFFAGGLWVNSDQTANLEDGLLDDFVRIFTYKAINFAWIDSGVFIMYVPYGTSIKDPNGNIISGIDQPWCESNLKDESYLGTLMICDAPGGMARIYNAGTISAATKDLAPTTPQGYDKSFNVISNENFNVTNAIRGSVASWRAGDFGYDAASPFQDVLSSGQPLSEQLATALANLHIGPETAGFFNIPVCGVYDLRFFPPAVGVTQTDYTCTACGQALGGMPGSTAQFWPNANAIVQSGLTPPPSCVQTYETQLCTQQCPSDPYGPSTQAPGKGGYTPGWCGVHVVQYQKNEGPGSDTADYRLTVTIYDGQQVEIGASNDTLVDAPTGEFVSFSSKLPSPLGIQAGATDDDPLWFNYPGQSNWQTGDQQHHCNFGAYDSGSRQGDCGFSCA